MNLNTFSDNNNISQGFAFIAFKNKTTFDLVTEPVLIKLPSPLLKYMIIRFCYNPEVSLMNQMVKHTAFEEFHQSSVEDTIQTIIDILIDDNDPIIQFYNKWKEYIKYNEDPESNYIDIAFAYKDRNFTPKDLGNLLFALDIDLIEDLDQLIDNN